MFMSLFTLRRLLLIIAAVFTITSTAVFASESSHFEPVASPDLTSALCNLTTYNAELSAIKDKTELTTLDMVKVHELTYTLEQAVAQLKSQIDKAALALEEVHIASESLDQHIIKAESNKYLDPIMQMTQPATCQ